MCSIIGSFKKEIVADLVRLNEERGNFSWSITINNKTKKGFGPFDFNQLEQIDEEGYIISHIQAPTGGSTEDENRIHPTINGETKLWHNGILTPRGIRFLQNELKTNETFDTKLLHDAIVKFGFEILSSIEGLFSCLYYDGEDYFIFRTKHGKLYIDSNLNLSSERFKDSKCINFDTIYKIDFKNKNISKVGDFKTKRFNYIIHGELE